MTLPELIERLQSLQRLDVIAPAMSAALSDLAALARSLAHVRTGTLRASLKPGPIVAVGAGTLEGRVRTTVFYAPYEVARGGAHDYVARTEAAAGAIERRMVAEIIAAYVRAIG